MYGWEIVEGRGHPIPIRILELNKILNMKMVGLMIRLNRAPFITGKEVIMDRGLCFLKGLLETRKRRVRGSALIKIYAIGIGGFMETLLLITSVQKVRGCGTS